jgi:hypothetical protein
MTNPQNTAPNNQPNSPQDYITEWMVSFVEKPHPLLGGMPPCPYARQARLKGRVKMVWISSAEPDSDCWTHIENTDFNKTEVLILITDRSRWTWQQAYDIRCELNKTFHKNDIVILEDHPDYNEKISGVNMSNGRYCLLFAQRLSKLNHLADVLENTSDYYKNWSQAELDDVVTWRRQDPQ